MWQILRIVENSISLGEETLFIHTKCEALYGWTPQNLFHPLQINDEFQPAGYHANVNIAMSSDYGKLHVILSETNDKTGPNPSYEIGNFSLYKKISHPAGCLSLSELSV